MITKSLYKKNYHNGNFTLKLRCGSSVVYFFMSFDSNNNDLDKVKEKINYKLSGDFLAQFDEEITSGRYIKILKEIERTLFGTEDPICSVTILISRDESLYIINQGSNEILITENYDYDNFNREISNSTINSKSKLCDDEISIPEIYDVKNDIDTYICVLNKPAASSAFGGHFKFHDDNGVVLSDDDIKSKLHKRLLDDSDIYIESGCLVLSFTEKSSKFELEGF